MSDEVHVVYAQGGLTVATFDRMCITAICGPVTSEFLRVSSEAGLKLTRARGDKIVSLTILRGDAPIPEAALREESARRARAANAWVSSGANVVLGEGFTASVIRSVLTAMTLLSGGPPRRTFSEVRPAMDWLATRMGVTPTDLAPVTEWSERTLRDPPAP